MLDNWDIGWLIQYKVSSSGYAGQEDTEKYK